MPTNLYGPGDNFDLETSHVLPAMREVSEDYFVNVGTGTDVTIRELAGVVSSVVGWNGKIHWDTYKPNGTPRKLMNVSKMTALGWTAQTSLRRGIEQTWEWFCSHKDEARGLVHRGNAHETFSCIAQTAKRWKQDG